MPPSAVVVISCRTAVRFTVEAMLDRTRPSASSKLLERRHSRPLNSVSAIWRQ